MVLVLLTAALIGLAMLAMAVGTIFSKRCLRGSCGGPDVLGADGEALTCDSCPRRRAPGTSGFGLRASGSRQASGSGLPASVDHRP